MKRTNQIFFAAIAGIGIVFSGLSVVSPASAQGIQLKSRSGPVAGGNAGIGGLAIPFGPNCASGFSLAGKKVNNAQAGPWTDWWVCSTPVLVCPAQLQTNGLYSGINPQAIVQTIGGNPDGGTIKFRVQYKCNYSWTPNATP